MLLALQQYPMKVVYKPGKEQVEVAKDKVPREQIFTVEQLKSFMSDLSPICMKGYLPVSEQIYNLS